MNMHVNEKAGRLSTNLKHVDLQPTTMGFGIQIRNTGIDHTDTAQTTARLSGGYIGRTNTIATHS